MPSVAVCVQECNPSLRVTRRDPDKRHSDDKGDEASNQPSWRGARPRFSKQARWKTKCAIARSRKFVTKHDSLNQIVLSSRGGSLPPRREPHPPSAHCARLLAYLSRLLNLRCAVFCRHLCAKHQMAQLIQFQAPRCYTLGFFALIFTGTGPPRKIAAFGPPM